MTEAMLCLISAILCLLTGAILLLYVGNNKADKYLGGFYLACGYAFTIAALTYDRFLDHVPHLYRTGNICWLICMPLSWLYVRTTIERTSASAWDLLHLLPLLLYLVDYFPFFILPASAKEAIFRADTANIGQMIRYRQGWLLPENSQIPIRAFQTMIYWLMQVGLLASPGAALLRKDRHWLRWMILYNLLQISMFLPTLITGLIGGQEYLWASTVPTVTAILLSAVTLFLHPRVLYGLPKIPAVVPVKRAPTVDPLFAERLRTQLEKIMRDEKPYLHPRYSLPELSETMGIPLHKISAFINQYTGGNFNEYLNEWRIHYCLDLLKDKKIAHLNLRGMANHCGFSNRNSFSAAFKKVTGQLPSEYLQSKEFRQ